MTQVSQAMTRGVRTMSPRDTLAGAAQAMKELDVGVIPVCDGERLVGVVTDRDIVLRGVAQGLQPDKARLTEVMSRDPACCYEDDLVTEALDRMRTEQIRRMPVLDRDRHLVGMLSLGDVAVRADEIDAGRALDAISKPAAPDRTA